MSIIIYSSFTKEPLVQTYKSYKSILTKTQKLFSKDTPKNSTELGSEQYFNKNIYKVSRACGSTMIGWSEPFVGVPDAANINSSKR